MGDETKVTITARMKILKFNEGETEPYDTVERDVVLTGEQAEALLKGGNTNATD